jgi:hypothetical protein
MKIAEAIKIIYPNLNGGFVYWHTQPNGEPWDNLLDGLEWRTFLYEKPTWQIIQNALTKIEDKLNSESKLLELQKNKSGLFNEYKELHKLVVAQNDGSCFILDLEKNMFDDDMNLKSGLFPNDYRVVEISNLPLELPEAWTDDFNTETIDIHNERAREVLLQKMRDSRLPKFAKLDIDSLRALEDGDIEWLQDIREKKQILRDITNPLKNFVIKKFNCPKTLEKLKELSKI